MLTAPEVYDLFVVRRGWTAARLGELVAETMIAALLPRSTATGPATRGRG
jgi:hypothetical protein